MNTPLRALVGARVSVLTGPQKVSHEAQLETASKWAEAHGHNIIGRFEDLGVSASVSPEERSDLGPWITERSHNWDVIVWAKMDRAFRSTRHCVDFAKWAEDNHKVVVFAEDGLKLDYRPGVAKGIDSMMAELFVYLGSFFAQLELVRFKSRAEDSHRMLRQTTRWASGAPPLGYRVCPHASGKGKGLEQDPESQELLRAMADRLLDGWSFVRITGWLNETGALTSTDRSRITNGREPKRKPWTTSNVIEILTSPRTQGFKMHNGDVVLNPDGEPISLAPASFDSDTWYRIQQAASLRKLNRREPTQSRNPLLGIGFCGCIGCQYCEHSEGETCGSSMALQVSRATLASGEVREYHTYRCGRTPINCRNTTIRAADVDELLEQEFLDQVGDEYVTTRVFVPGEDHSHELEQVNRTIDRLRAESDAGLLTTEADTEVWLQRLRVQTARRDELAAKPSRSSGWEAQTTSETYSQAWGGLTPEAKRQLLIDRGIRFEMVSAFPFSFRLMVPWLPSS